MQKETSTTNPLLVFMAGSALTLLAVWLINSNSKSAKSLEVQFHEAMEQERYTDAHKIHCKMREQNPSIRDLKEMMDDAAEKEDYEKAVVYRDAINSRLQKKAS